MNDKIKFTYKEKTEEFFSVYSLIEKLQYFISEVGHLDLISCADKKVVFALENGENITIDLLTRSQEQVIKVWVNSLIAQ